MTFPFPGSPYNGQQVTHTLSDGSVLVATYDASKNDWKVERQAPNAGSLVLKANVPYVIPAAGNDGDALTWDATLKKWVPRAVKGGSGSQGATYIKPTKATPDTSNPPPGTTNPLQRGALQSTVENLHKELKAWDGAGWSELFSEDSIKAWIAAGSLFRSTLVEAGINPLPTPDPSNRGYYWTWAGASGYVVKSTDIPLAPDLTGEVLNPGDWLQSDGTKYVHVSGDLLSKQRWLSLGSFLPWSDTSWESGSVVSYQKAFYRSTRNIVAGDPAPGDGSTGNPWTDITPLPHLGLEDLKKVNANVTNPNHGEVFQWDDNVGEWVASDTLTIGAVKFDELGDEITGFASADFSEAPTPVDEYGYVTSVAAVKQYVQDNKPYLEDLPDCTELGAATDGQVPVWSDTNNRWEPKTLTSPIIYLGSGAWNAANVASKADNYGMAVDTVPDPKVWTPQPGDQYIDLLSGNVTVFTSGGTTTPASPAPGRSDPTTITGGAAPIDLTPDAANSIPYFRGTYTAGTVAPTSPAEGDIWVNQNTNPPHFEVYKNGAWVQHDFANDPNSLGLLGDLANVDLGTFQPKQGDSLIYNPTNEKWVAGSPPAHIKKWDPTDLFTSGTTAYHNNRLWVSAHDNTNSEPRLNAGDVLFFTTNASGVQVGPYIPSYFNVVPDATVAPTVTPPATGGTSFRYYAIQWQTGNLWSLWRYNFTTTAWDRQTLTSVNTWRSEDLPQQLSGNNLGLLWIYDTPNGTATPHVGQTDWALLSITSSLNNLTDVRTTGLSKDDILQYDGNGHWQAVANDLNHLAGITFTSLADGDIIYYDNTAKVWKNKPEINELDELTDVSAATPASGDILTYDTSQSKWNNTAPQLELNTNVAVARADASAKAQGDALIWDAANSTWRPAPLLQPALNPNVQSQTLGLTEAAIKTALDAKQNLLPTHAAADATKLLAVAADGSLMWAQPASSATTVLPPVANFAALPATANNGDIVVTLDTTTMYVWAGTPPQWHSIGGAAGGALPGLPTTVTEKLIPVGDASRTVTWQANKLVNLNDVRINGKPDYGTTLIYNSKADEYIAGLPFAKIDNWEAHLSYSNGMLVFHDGSVWRSITRSSASVNEEPKFTNGQVHAYYTKANGAMVGPVAINFLYSGNLNDPPTDTPTVNSGTWMALRYTNDTTYSLWKWEFDLPGYQATGAISYAWVQISVAGGASTWRHSFHPPKITGASKALLWIYGDEQHTYAPIIGTQKWEVVDFSSSLVSQSDVNAFGATAGQMLVADGNGKWNATTVPTLPATSAGQTNHVLQSNGTTFVQKPVRFPNFARVSSGFTTQIDRAFSASEHIEHEVRVQGWFSANANTHLHLILEIGGVNVDWGTTSTDVHKSGGMALFGGGGIQSMNHLTEGHGNQIVFNNGNYNLGSGYPAFIDLSIYRTNQNWYAVNSLVYYQSDNNTPEIARMQYFIDRDSRMSERITRLGIQAGISSARIQGDLTYEWG